MFSFVTIHVFANSAHLIVIRGNGKKLQQLVNVNQFAFDVELLQKAHKRGYKISEVTVSVNSTKSKSIKDILKCLHDVIILWFRS